MRRAGRKKLSKLYFFTKYKIFTKNFFTKNFEARHGGEYL
jgi:hypothetical protein